MLSFFQKKYTHVILAFLMGMGFFVALIYQYVFESNPCVLCVYLRVVFISLALLSALNALWLPKKAFQLLLFGLQGFVTVWGIQIAYELYTVQTNPSPFTTCSFFPEFWIPLEQWLPGLFMPTGMCSDDVVMILGLSMASWCLLVLSVYGVINLIHFGYLTVYDPSKRQKKNKN